MFDPHLQKDEIISNRRLMDIFHCACEGGIRYSSKSGAIVLIVNNTKDGLPNTWEGEKLFFAGRPLKHGMSGANKRLEEFLRERKDIFLFEVNTAGQYQYKGAVIAAGDIYKKTADTGIEYPVFPLRIVNFNK